MYTFLYNTFIYNEIKMYETISIVFGTVHSNRTVAVLGRKGRERKRERGERERGRERENFSS
jgi:hypothetical protein